MDYKKYSELSLENYFSKLFVLIFVPFLFLFSCQNNQNQKMEGTTMDVSENEFNANSLTSINPDEIIDTLSYKVIRLESIKESMFGGINKLIVTDDYILVFDMDIAKAVLMFDWNGNFLRKIGRDGRGPGEYARLSDVDIDSNNNQIILYDLNARKLIFYDYEGSFLKEIKLTGYYGMKFSFINDSLFAFYLHYLPKLKNELLFMNAKGELINSNFKRKNRNKNSILLNLDYFAKNGSKTYIIPSYYGKIYEITNENNITEKIDFHIDNDMITDKDLRKLKKPEEIFKLGKFIPLRELRINSKGQFFCNSNFDNQTIHFIGDLRSEKVIAYSRFSNSKHIPDNIISTYKDFFITVQHPIIFKNSIFPDADISENSCLVFFKLQDSVNELNN